MLCCSGIVTIGSTIKYWMINGICNLVEHDVY